MESVLFWTVDVCFVYLGLPGRHFWLLIVVILIIFLIALMMIILLTYLLNISQRCIFNYII